MGNSRGLCIDHGKQGLISPFAHVLLSLFNAVACLRAPRYVDTWIRPTVAKIGLYQSFRLCFLILVLCARLSSC